MHTVVVTEHSDKLVFDIFFGFNFFTSPRRPDRLWGPPNLLYNGYRGLFPGSKTAGA
jgi:hypothetical protein